MSGARSAVPNLGLVMTVLRSIYNRLPPRTREKLKTILGAHGHGKSRLDAMKAHDHAVGKKRLDKVAEAMAKVFNAANVSSLEGKTCLEFGAGYAPSELLVFHLLGGVELTATDYNPLIRLSSLVTAARRADRARVLSALSPFADPAEMERKLDALTGEGNAAHAEAERIISYVAPFDMSQASMPRKFDFIHSISVLEHLPPSIVKAILENLSTSLTGNGFMIHEIDLTDHRDQDAPLAFLSRTDDYDPQRDFDLRGNRLRRSDWLDAFGALERMEMKRLYESQVDSDKIPTDLLPQFIKMDLEELCSGYIGLLSKARPNAA